MIKVLSTYRSQSLWLSGICGEKRPLMFVFVQTPDKNYPTHVEMVVYFVGYNLEFHTICGHSVLVTSKAHIFDIFWRSFRTGEDLND